MGQLHSTTRCSESDGDSPALAAFLHITVRPSWQWSPTGISCLDPRTQGPCTPGLSSLDAHETASWQVCHPHVQRMACVYEHQFVNKFLLGVCFRAQYHCFWSADDSSWVLSFSIWSSGMLPMFLIWLYRARVCSGGLMTLMESWMTLNQVSDSSLSADLWLS